ncbi:hypothetical protein AMECASPLE_022045 [Ameca splendens]|uniref:Uncharacterized protein n=1 Tax=Ameca splendens TaxID=208324 RepID=A0ABV0ZNI5_9TELE
MIINSKCLFADVMFMSVLLEIEITLKIIHSSSLQREMFQLPSMNTAKNVQIIVKIQHLLLAPPTGMILPLNCCPPKSAPCAHLSSVGSLSRSSKVYDPQSFGSDCESIAASPASQQLH